MPKDYHDEVKNLQIGDVIKVDRRFGFHKVVKLFKEFGYEYEEIVKPEATWAKNVRRTA